MRFPFPRALPALRGRPQRRIAAALCLGAAVALIAWLAIPRQAGTAVAVAAHDIASGTQLAAGDVEVRRYPAELVPTGAHASAQDLVGSTAGGALGAGSPITDAGLLAPGAQPAAAGEVLVPVSVADEAAASVLRPGHHVRIYSTAEQKGTADGGSDALPGASDGALVDDAVVAAVKRDAGSALAGGPSTVLTLAVPAKRAAALAASAGAGLGFALLN
ncbi:hypothetical protein GSY69_08305 [Brevibacterium sp. 5221]|uniref:SAF domain-containing protein n=1 Tax=Brevibacterium rongguiense TaxID=2695267 RepID=A0A6N9H7B9_9MICO|nr:SAF domain-containing protein [Brevibacterium rongguiense]MYM19968.1 hypothetical protein [Brevibacterium rongguiense]